MASLTVRQLDEALKKRLRLRAAKNGRSVEEEIRFILRAAARDGETFAAEAAAHGNEKRGAARHETERKPVLLIIGGGIAAYKSLDLIRRLRERGLAVRVAMTEAAAQFVTPLAAGALAGARVFTGLFDPDSEFDVGHIRLAREAELIVVAPATADLIAKMAHGLANDLATAVLLAARARILIAPAMNPAMWGHRATRRNLETLIADGVHVVGPNAGEMAEANEAGLGRMAEPAEIAEAALALAEGGARRFGGQARAGDVGADPRADRSGALHRQPLVRQAGPCHRRGGGGGRRAGHAGVGAGRDPRSAGGARGQGRDGARHAARGRGGAAGRRRRVRRGRGRLENGGKCPAED